MHLDGIGLPQIIVSSNYDVPSRKIFSRWSVQLLDESPLFGTDDVSIGSHVSCTIIDWLTHNNARDDITLQFISFFKPFLSFVLPFLSFFNRFSYHFFLSSFNSRSLSSGTDRLDSRS